MNRVLRGWCDALVGERHSHRLCRKSLCARIAPDECHGGGEQPVPRDSQVLRAPIVLCEPGAATRSTAALIEALVRTRELEAAG